MILNLISTFLVELHQDLVLEVLLVVEVEFLSFERHLGVVLEVLLVVGLNILQNL